MNLRFGSAALLAALALCLPTLAQDPAAERFEKTVRPVLATRCYSCHGPDKQWAGLRVDSRAALLKGGDHGPAIVPGSDAGRLLDAVRHTGAVKMPPEGKLADAEIAAIADWVKSGAVWPGEVAKPANDPRKTHWAFQPVTRPTPPAVKNAAAAPTSIDRFIVAALERKGLRPARPADRTTLLRRVTLDLIGLPPTPEQTAAFVADTRPDAYERVVDRLLASTHYGERWGRQWLDVARYSDTLGYLVGTAGRRFPYAYTYRDYVIRALNEDKPYDQFVREQLAADLIPLRDRRDLAALGFLTVGNRYLGDIQEILDDRIDVVGRGLQGLTLGCARCHTHKFDPVPIDDYYSLYGVFNNSPEVENPPQIDSAPDATQYADFQKKLAALDARRAEAAKKKDNGALEALRLEKIDFLAGHPGAPPCAMTVRDNPTPTPQRVFLRGASGSPGAEVPRQYLAVVAGAARKPFTQGSGRRELAEAIVDPKNPLTARVIVNRIWLGHFGRGLVRTPSDFGTRGEAPTHPELLDWLANVLMDEGWSLKRLHRRIVLSATYRQSCDPDPKTAAADPDNRLLGRQNRRRLDFEQLRDGYLKVSGKLDERLYGQPQPGLDTSRRRTLYTFLDRQSLPVLWRAFDFPDPNAHAPQRPNTTVPQQSLYLLNNPFVQQTARALVEKVGPSASALTAAVYGRPARREELALAERFVAALTRNPPQVEAAATPAWRYGYGGIDPSTHRLTGFTPLTHFSGSMWQASATFPDPMLGYVSLHAGGGHPGIAGYAAVRRWVAPRAMTIAVSGTLTHPSPSGNGVRAVVCKNLADVLADVTVAHTTGEVAVAKVTVAAGDTLDFVVDFNGELTSDSFAWAPVLTEVSGAGKWSAGEEFGGPFEAPKPMGVWDLYAQALLISNRFLYVD